MIVEIIAVMSVKSLSMIRFDILRPLVQRSHSMQFERKILGWICFRMMVKFAYLMQSKPDLISSKIPAHCPY